jgi:hypothetical protein
MSAAEPVDPTRAFMNPGRDAAVIPLSKRRSGRGGRRSVRGWRNTMTPPTDSTPPDEGNNQPRDPLAQFAETIEMSFLESGRSLSEPSTAQVFLKTLDIFARALEGSEANGIINRGQLEELAAVIDGMRQAPRLV